MIAVPSPPGRWNTRPWLRAQMRNSTAAATSRTAASTKLKTPNALTLRLTNVREPSGTYDCVYQGRNSVSTRAAAATPALRSSGGSSRRRSTALTTPSLSFDRDVLHVARERLAALQPRDVPVEHRAQRQQELAERLAELVREVGRDDAAQRLDQRGDLAEVEPRRRALVAGRGPAARRHRAARRLLGDALRLAQ